MVVAEGIDESALTELARKLSGVVGEGGVIYLAGPLGAGKTTFARALLTALGVGSRVKSPTYALIESYAVGDLGVQHLDLYRISDSEEVEWLGLRDFAEPQLWLIEWPERVRDGIPKPDLVISLVHSGIVRDARFDAETQRGSAWLAALSDNAKSAV